MKPQVRYKDLSFLRVGLPAMVMPIDHPSEFVSNHVWATTSTVQAILYESSNGPVFETENTIYLPADTDEYVPEASPAEDRA